MKTFPTLLRAVLSQDMSIFKIRAKSRASKFLLPIILAVVVMLSIGSYAYAVISALPGCANLILLIALLIVSLITLLEGIYKSGSVLFDSKDNDLLLSLPLSRRQVFTARVLKLTIFQFCLNLVFLLPIFLVYAVETHPGPSFYPLALLMLILLPLIPTAFAALIAYFIRRISVRFRMPKLIQSILMIIVFVAVVFVMGGLTPPAESSDLLASVDSIQNMIILFYYPCGVFIELLQKFALIKFIIFLAVNILPFLLVVWIGSFRYFKIISRSRIAPALASAKAAKFSVHSPIVALVHKELSRFFSSTVYMFNTLPSLVILVALTIALCTNTDGLVSTLTATEGFPATAEQIYSFLPIIAFLVIVFVCATVSITPSSISIEGRTFNITKTLPLSSTQILLAKILATLVIICPVVIVCALALIFRFQISSLVSLAILLASIIFPFLFGVIGLFFNLKYPKMDASNDTEVVKQSLSPMLSMVTNLIILAVVAAASIALSFITNLAILIVIAIFAFLTVFIWRILVRYGQRRIAEIVA